ncbi:MAG: 23S rRNA (adenine(2503)-C(2))-methyltransferase RlmN [Bacteroidetes bacterium]|nr:23S rRNA (adenine(2503)-C(2))-methyltransferase RlmN [Bacteroidota bacterium]
MNKTDNLKFVKNFSEEELIEYFSSINEKPYRAKQLYDWLYVKESLDFDEMLNFSKSLREHLKDNFEITTVKQKEVQHSSSGTKKLLLETYDNKFIESVIIPDGERVTLCLSTQVGCPLDCKFCATGLMGYKRNLTPGEIVDQYIHSKSIGSKITNIVYMGMGEPLLNFKNTLESLRIFTDTRLETLSRNRITVSTSGITPKIIELADSGLRVQLALSLHSTFEDIRSKIMPINVKYDLKSVLIAVEYYLKMTDTKITYEYTMLKDLNDRDEDIKSLTKLCKRMPSKINIIPFNSIKHMSPGGLSAELEPTSRNKLMLFADKLRNNGITVMVRETQGDDIAAACGQLAVKSL